MNNNEPNGDEKNLKEKYGPDIRSKSMDTITTFHCLIQDADGKEFDCHATAECEFDERTPGEDSRYDEPLYRMDFFRVEDVSITDEDGKEIEHAKTLADLSERFSSQKDEIEARAVDALTEKLWEEV